MRIGIYIENYRAGGLDRVVIDTINHWPSKDDHFVLFCNDIHEGLYFLKKSIQRDVAYVIYPTTIFMRYYNRLLNRCFLFQLNRIFYNILGCYLAMLWEVPRLLQLFKKNHLDVVMIHNGGWPAARSVRSAAIAGRLAGIKTILIIHGLAQRHHFAISIQEKCLEYLLSQIGVSVVAISHSTKDYLAQYSLLPPANVIYSGMRELSGEVESMSQSNDIVSELGLDKSDFLVGMFATYEFFRGHAFMMKVMKKLLEEVPNANLLVAGTGNRSEKETIYRLVFDNGLQNNVHLLGFRTDVAQIMNYVDVVVQPMQTYASFGLLIVEAMALKRPVVASSLDGILEIVEDGVTGFLASPADPESFARSLAVLARDSELRLKMGEAGYERYMKCFHASRMANDYHAYIS